jgi:hypothetical protein
MNSSRSGDRGAERHPHRPPSQARQLTGVRGARPRECLRRRSSSVGDVDPGDREVPATLTGWRPTTRHIRSWPPIRSASTMPRSSISTSSMPTRFMRRCRPTSRSGSLRRWWGCSCTSSTGSRAGRFSGFTTSSQRSGRPGRGFALPDDRGPITIHDVIAEPPGERRDRAIESLATSTWNACRGLRGSIQAFLSLCGVTPPST